MVGAHPKEKDLAARPHQVLLYLLLLGFRGLPPIAKHNGPGRRRRSPRNKYVFSQQQQTDLGLEVKSYPTPSHGPNNPIYPGGAVNHSMDGHLEDWRSQEILLAAAP